MRICTCLVATALVALSSAGHSYAGGLGLLLSTGYGLSLGGAENLGGDGLRSRTYDASFNLTSVEDHYLSIGKGLKIELGVQPALNEHFALRVGGGYSMFPTLKMVDKGSGWEELADVKASALNLYVLGVASYQRVPMPAWDRDFSWAAPPLR